VIASAGVICPLPFCAVHVDARMCEECSHGPCVIALMPGEACECDRPGCECHGPCEEDDVGDDFDGIAAAAGPPGAPSMCILSLRSVASADIR
jgi:hypothetical protein